jgi:hypothetical protein
MVGVFYGGMVKEAFGSGEEGRCLEDLLKVF